MWTTYQWLKLDNNGGKTVTKNNVQTATLVPRLSLSGRGMQRFV